MIKDQARHGLYISANATTARTTEHVHYFITLQYHGRLRKKVYTSTAFTTQHLEFLPYSPEKSYRSVGRMSRTDNFRNACCLHERESTTNRAKSQTNRSFIRHLITSSAKSETVPMRFLPESRSSKATCTGADRNASRKRLRGRKLTEQLNKQCHSVSTCNLPCLALQNRQQRFNSESRKPGNLDHRDSCEFHRAKSSIPSGNHNKLQRLHMAVVNLVEIW